MYTKRQWREREKGGNCARMGASCNTHTTCPPSLTATHCFYSSKKKTTHTKIESRVFLLLLMITTHTTTSRKEACAPPLLLLFLLHLLLRVCVCNLISITISLRLSTLYTIGRCVAAKFLLSRWMCRCRVKREERGFIISHQIARHIDFFSAIYSSCLHTPRLYSVTLKNFEPRQLSIICVR